MTTPNNFNNRRHKRMEHLLEDQSGGGTVPELFRQPGSGSSPRTGSGGRTLEAALRPSLIRKTCGSGSTAIGTMTAAEEGRGSAEVCCGAPQPVCWSSARSGASSRFRSHGL